MNRPRTGFTLVELLVVIAILALMSGAAIVVYDEVQQRAELSMAQHQMALVRDALMRFRMDMGYFPGEGPLVAEALDLTRYHFVDPSAPAVASAKAEVQKRWADHPLNLWMLFEKPRSLTDATRWDWKPGAARGWRGPYLGRGTNWLLDEAGMMPSGFRGGATTNRLYAVADLIRKDQSGDPFLRWVAESAPPTELVAPVKTPQRSPGSPIAFVIERPVIPVPPAVPTAPPVMIYKLVSAGADGIFQTTGTERAGDDIVVEITRRPVDP